MRKVDPSEIERLGVRAAIEQEYDGYLSDFTPGDYGIAELEDGEARPTIRNRLQAAAERRGFVLHFIRTQGSAIRFRVEEDDVPFTFTPVEQEEELLEA